MRVPDGYAELSGDFWGNLWNGTVRTAETITNINNAVQNRNNGNNGNNNTNNGGGTVQPNVIVVPSNNTTPAKSDNTMLYVCIGLAAVSMLAVVMFGKK